METYTDKTENVQDAWNEIIQVIDGIDAKGATIQQMRDTIRTAHWSRDTQHFKFGDYCTKNISANNDLNRYSANVDGASQVQAFLRAIKADAATNPHSLGIKTTVLTGPTTKDDIYKAVTTFKDTMHITGMDVTSSVHERHRAHTIEVKVVVAMVEAEAVESSEEDTEGIIIAITIMVMMVGGIHIISRRTFWKTYHRSIEQ